MLPGEILIQIYLVSAVLGVGFITFNFITGQIRDGGDGSGAGGHGLGASTSGGAGGHGLATSSSGGGDVHDSGVSHTGGGHPPNSYGSQGSSGQLRQAMMSTSSQSLALAPDALRSKIERTILEVLSPMGMAISLAFFGLAGLFIFANLPWLGWLTLIPALLFSFLVSSTFKAGLRWMAKSSTKEKPAK